MTHDIFQKKFIKNRQKKSQITICAHLGEGVQLLNGQTIKSKNVVDAIKKKYINNNICIIDTYGFQKNPFKLLIKIVTETIKSRNIIIMPAQRGVKVIAPIVSVLSNFFYCRIHYIVIGGWLSKLLSHNEWLLKYLRSFHGIYVETESMVKQLNKLGLNNAFLLRNFKSMCPINKIDIKIDHQQPYKLCTFSRVMPEKGITIACNVIEKITVQKGQKYISLDIYGQIEKGYENWFKELIKKCSHNIRYCGAVDSSKSSQILSKYDALLFPTYYDGEGVPGTIIDAFFAGVPVIASDWHFNSEIISNGITGIIFKNERQLYKYLLHMDQNINKIKEMKRECVMESKKYTEQEFLENFCTHLL